MTLIKSISGIRGTIGGHPGQGLTPVDVVRFCYAYCECLKKNEGPPQTSYLESLNPSKLQEHPLKPKNKKFKVVVGRDGRMSGEMMEQLVCGSLIACGVDVVRCSLASTPTVELAVDFAEADGGIIITASHNPKEWNALKLLNSKGEFLSKSEGEEIIRIAESGDFHFASTDELGHIEDRDFTEEHVNSVLALEAVDVETVRNAHFKVVVDTINSVGSIVMPRLLDKLGVEYVLLNSVPDGNFAHNPEPLVQNLKELSEAVVKEGADLGISVDPDVDRLAFFCENGEAFGEEYTLVAVADYILQREVEKKGREGKELRTVSNLSSSRALKDISQKWGGTWEAAAVGEVNVTTKMRQNSAIIGGEGNGGVIYPTSHYGRDAVVGTALFLSHLALMKKSASEYRATLPQYYMAKQKLEIDESTDFDSILGKVARHYAKEELDTQDGLRIDFKKRRTWVQLRKSNTEAIVRIYSEAPSSEEAEALGREVIGIVKELL